MFHVPKAYVPPVEEEVVATGIVCSACGDDLHYAEEIVYMTVARVVTGGGLEPVHNDEGDFYFEPHFLEFNCWESLVEDLRERLEEVPPTPHNDGVLTCSYCKSAICTWEILATSYVGELHVSPRSPNGHPTPVFNTQATPFLTCLSCLLHQSYDLDLWDTDLNQIGECEECSHARCWRQFGQAPCSCICHAPRSDDETTV